MSKSASTGSVRPRPVATSSKSFHRFESSSSAAATPRTRASTLQTPPSPKSTRQDGAANRVDIFEKPLSEEPESPDISRADSLPDRFDELPVELASLTDRFIESLTTKSYNEPPSIDYISDLFQEFYLRASMTVNIHISTLMSRLHRDSSPAQPKPSSIAKALSSKSSFDSISSAKSGGGQQMMTASEVAEKRKARKMLEYKRVLLEEGVERRACERVYNRIWRHKSTLDEVRDEKLRSKTGALALVGIGLRDLGVELQSDNGKTLEDVQESLAPARESLAKMSEEKFPLGKLQHLTGAHKAIVDTLSTVQSSSSSADDILPTLIYTLITSPMEGIDIISNLYFIQRFRATSKIDGEAAYCMTNLEAAISFLENVDLATLRADEQPEGPPKVKLESSNVDKAEPFPILPTTTSVPGSATTAVSTFNASGDALGLPEKSSTDVLGSRTSLLPSPRHQRTLSDLLQPGKQAISSANEAVRSTAEEGFRNISNTLDNSFQFLLGRLKQRSDEEHAEVIVPKTLDEARQLVNRPLTLETDDMALSESSSMAGDTESPQAQERLLTILGGKKTALTRERERSVDSQRSTGSSNKKVAFAASFTDPSGSTLPKPLPSPAQANNPFDQMKSLGTTLNPLNHLGAVNPFSGGFRAFATKPSPPPGVAEKEKTKEREKKQDLMNLLAPSEELIGTFKAEPPIQKFLDMHDWNELKIGEIQELLKDYQRISGLLKSLEAT